MPYIGRSTDGFGVRNRFLYLASASDTSVSGADANGATLTFTDGAYVDVYLNGVLLKAGTDYNTNTANTIAGLSALAANDEVTVIVYDVFTVGDMVSATSGGTFTGNVTHNGTVTFGSTVSGLDVNGTEVILDADGDTSITADTDDQIDLKVGGTDTLVVKSDVVEIKGSHPDLKLMDTDDNNYGGLFYNNGSMTLATDHDATGATGIIKFAIDGNEDVRIDGGGDLTINDGDLVIGTSGHGIDFSAVSTSGSGSASAILDDYEEGTFTFNSNANIGFVSNSNVGRYTKIGNMVHVQLYVDISSVSSTNHFYLSGMPFTAGTNSTNTYNGYSTGTVQFYNTNTYWSGSQFTSRIGNESSNMYFYESYDNSNWSIVTNSRILSSTEMIISHTYFV